jgi:hypothetical protein
MEEAYNELLLEDYDLERMTPQERREAWEQQHLNEFQGLHVPRSFGTPFDPLEQYGQVQEEQH